MFWPLSTCAGAVVCGPSPGLDWPVEGVAGGTAGVVCAMAPAESAMVTMAA